jgi:LysM repeat protein
VSLRTLLQLSALVFALSACAPQPAPTRLPTASPALRPLPSATRSVLAATATPGAAATPVIIASPTATATPVTHLVQEGETLLGIAIDYGVSVEALQAANPAVQVRFLSIGTVLIIPPPEGGFAVAATNLAPPPPAPVHLSQPVCYTLPTESLYCLVEARNPGGLALENVSARLTLAGADGLPVTSTVLFSALDLIPPGGAAPMAALFQPAPSVPIAATGLELLTGNLAGEPAPPGRAVPLEVSGASGALQAGRFVAAGQVRNGNAGLVSTAWVTLSLYGADGALIGYRRQPLPAGLAPGEAAGFSLAADVLRGAVERFVLLAEGRP